MMNWPLALTWFRIAAIPFVVLVYLLPFPWAGPAASLIFAVAALTDWLDGYLARSLSQATPLGAFLDPVADKLLVAASLILIVDRFSTSFVVLPAIIIVGREIVISALREWMAEVGRRASIAVNYMGKVKTVCQMVALGVLLWYNPGTWFWVRPLGLMLLYIAAFLTLWSMLIYLHLSWPELTQKES